MPTKLLLLVVGALLLLSVGYSALSLARLDKEFEDFRTENLEQGQAQFVLHSTLIQERISTWLESFADVVHVKDQDDFNDLKNALALQYDALQINYNVENVWLTDQSKQAFYATDTMPDFVTKAVNQVLVQQTPIFKIYCETECAQLIALPLLNKNSEMSVVAMTVSLIDMISSLKTAIKNDITIVSYANTPDEKFNQAEFISFATSEKVISLFQQDSEQNLVSHVTKNGLQIDIEQGNFLINLMPLYQNEQQQFYLALIDDVTPFNRAFYDYRRLFLLSSFLIFFTLAVLVYFVAKPFAQRLLVLSNVLPLLAHKQFDKFRKIKIKGKHFFTDELDILADASIKLSYELEQLNIEVDQKTKELENIAMYDLLTGLPNRNMLNYQLRKAIVNLSQYKKNVSVLFLDLDDFKKVNDSNGHNEGDKLLIEAANRVRLSIRKIDIACRFGGDEFVVILGDVENVDQACTIAEKILESFRDPIKVGSSLFYVSTSIGIAYSENFNVKADELISHADIAMYEAKDNGGARYHLYHSDMYQRVAQRVMLEAEVRQALSKNQFSLSLQPQVRAKDKKLYGFEALLRWHHPERGMISPDDFIPILENSEYMVELGYWVIKRCFELLVEIQKWGLKDIRIAINLSAGQFIDKHLPGYLQTLLDEYNVSAKNFELELTEQTLVKDIDRAIDMMKALKETGFSFAIDDFGTGYSSLAYIKKMPVDVIKIDKSFIFGMLENKADYQIIMSTIAMVKNLGLQVIAEGVESSAQLRSLTENDCDLIQGYYFSKPVPEKELLTFLTNKIDQGYWKTKALN